MNRAILPLLLGLGCAESDLAKGDLAGAADELDSADEGGQVSLRLDVYPSDETPWLEPQSYLPGHADDLHDLDIELSTSVTLAGRVTGFEATPFGVPADVTVPGDDDIPVMAEVDIVLPGTTTALTVNTAEDGGFAVGLPAASGYTIAIVPLDPGNLPTWIVQDYALLEDVSNSYYLSYGAPVYGWVRQSDGMPCDGPVRAFLLDDETGVAGAPVWLDANGHYMLRALDGDYTLVIQGDDTSPQPRVETAISVADGDPVEVDVDVGIVEVTTTRGHLVDSRGRPVKDAIVRFTAPTLTDASGSAVVVTETDGSGVFNVDLLPGSWTAEFIAPYDSEGETSPLSQAVAITDPGTLDLGDLHLGSGTRLRASVRDQEGYAAANVIVTAQEQGFNHYIYSTVTDGDGEFQMDVPEVPLVLTLSPSDDNAAITHHDLPLPSDAPETFLLEQGTLVGGRISARSNEAVAWALVELRTSDGELYGSSLTDGNGEFSVRVSNSVAP